jgi:hypothetical protein
MCLGKFKVEGDLDKVHTRRAPVARPAAPSPAIALPTIKQAELGAAAHRTEPTSKMTSVPKYIHLTLNSAYIFPIINWKAHAVNKYAEPYQPTSPSELNSVVIFGMAVAIIERSCMGSLSALNIKCLLTLRAPRTYLTKLLQKTPKKIPMNIENTLTPEGYSSSDSVAVTSSLFTCFMFACLLSGSMSGLEKSVISAAVEDPEPGTRLLDQNQQAAVFGRVGGL